MLFEFRKDNCRETRHLSHRQDILIERGKRDKCRPERVNIQTLVNHRQTLTSANSQGIPLSANELHLLSPGNNPANRILTSSSGRTELSTNTFFSNPSNNTSIARSRQFSKVSAKSDEHMTARVSSRRDVKGTSAVCGKGLGIGRLWRSVGIGVGVDPARAFERPAGAWMNAVNGSVVLSSAEKK